MWVDSTEGCGSTFHFSMELQWEGEAADCTQSASSACACASAAMAGGGSRRSTDGGSGPRRSLTLSRCSSASAELAALRRSLSSGSISSIGSPAATTGSGLATESLGGGSGSGTGTGTGTFNGSSGRGAEEQRLLLQNRHEALLQQLAQTAAPLDGATTVAVDPDPISRLSAATDAPDTPSPDPDTPFALPDCARASSSSLLDSLAGSSAALTPVAAGTATAPQPLDSLQQLMDRHRRSNSEGLPQYHRLSSDSMHSSSTPSGSRRSRGSAELGRPPRPPQPAVDYRLSSFYTSSQPPPALPLPSGAVPGGPGTEEPQPAGRSQQGTEAAATGGSDSQAAAAAGSTAAAGPEAGAAAASGCACSEGDDCGGSTASAPAASGKPRAVEAAPARVAASVSSLKGAPQPLRWQKGSHGAESLRGRHVVVDVAHAPTAVQVAQSCGQLGMVAVRQSCTLPPPAAQALEGGGDAGATGGSKDFCITTADKALEGEALLHRWLHCTVLRLFMFSVWAAMHCCCVLRSLQHADPPVYVKVPSSAFAAAAVRAGWRGQPLVVLGRRDDLPLNLQALATTVRLAGGCVISKVTWAASTARGSLHRSSPNACFALPACLPAPPAVPAAASQ